MVIYVKVNENDFVWNILYIKWYNFFIASICGTISAGYTIEQDGLPRLNKVNGDEFWNDHKLTPSEEFIKFIEEH